MSRLFLVLLGCTLVMGCSGSGSGGDSDNPLRNVVPVNSKSKYASVLKTCVIKTEVEEGCDLNTLPLIGMENPVPDKESIMNRLLVSHGWMANRFSEMLDLLPDSIYPLFKSVSAIVIDDDINPSFYRPVTAAIYIDPNFLWLTSGEKSTIKAKNDFRSNFGEDLKFRFLVRYVIDNDYAFTGGDTESRTADDNLLNFARMLFHELSHAVDRAPPAIFDILDRSRPVGLSLYDHLENWTSWRLVTTYPLLDEELKDLAAVRYRGEDATEFQQQIMADYVGALMENDRSIHLYNYSVVYEDSAILFETTLMKYHFNAELDVAVANKPEQNLCENYLVSWGVRNRLALGKVSERAELVVQEMLPGYTDWASFFANTEGEYISMVAGDSWCDNLVLTSTNLLTKHQLETLNKNTAILNKQAVAATEMWLPYQ